MGLPPIMMTSKKKKKKKIFFFFFFLKSLKYFLENLSDIKLNFMISFGILVEYDQKKKVNSNVNKLIVKILLW